MVLYLLAQSTCHLIAQDSSSLNGLSDFIEIRSHNDYYYINRSSDRYFSSGNRLIVQSQLFQNGLLGFGHFFPWQFQKEAAPNIFQLQLDHNIYTPFDILTDNPAEMDRPYAGLLLMHLINHTYLEKQKAILKKEILLGWVGPAVRAQEIQNWFHKLTRWPAAKGWNFQLRNQLVYGLELAWWQAFNPHSPEKEHNLAYEIKAHLSSLTSEINLGLHYQAGHFLPLISPKHPFKKGFAWNFFIKLDLTIIPHNNLINGQVLSVSSSQKLSINRLIPVLLRGEHGFRLRFQSWELSLGQQVLSPEFRGGAAHLSGSISLRKYFH